MRYPKFCDYPSPQDQSCRRIESTLGHNWMRCRGSTVDPRTPKTKRIFCYMNSYIFVVICMVNVHSLYIYIYIYHTLSVWKFVAEAI